MQLALHPDFKVLDTSLKPIVLLSNQQHRPDARDELYMYDKVVGIIMAEIMAHMESFVMHKTDQTQRQPVVSEDLLMFGHAHIHQRQSGNQALQNQVQEELRAWKEEESTLQYAGNVPEDITTYWGRQWDTRRYKLLPGVARTIFSVPSSSAQLERDFGVSGMQVTPLRNRLASHCIVISAFINRNQEFLGLTQCQPIFEEERADCIPTNVFVDFEPESSFFPNTSIYDEAEHTNEVQ
jgi:hypothetical protein